jgi:hypothetical protein
MPVEKTHSFGESDLEKKMPNLGSNPLKELVKSDFFQSLSKVEKIQALEDCRTEYPHLNGPIDKVINAIDHNLPLDPLLNNKQASST